jgi:hypothetical protein
MQTGDWHTSSKSIHLTVATCVLQAYTGSKETARHKRITGRDMSMSEATNVLSSAGHMAEFRQALYRVFQPWCPMFELFDNTRHGFEQGGSRHGATG